MGNPTNVFKTKTKIQKSSIFLKALNGKNRERNNVEKFKLKIKR
jgi:hypothetical protein